MCELKKIRKLVSARDRLGQLTSLSSLIIFFCSSEYSRTGPTTVPGAGEVCIFVVLGMAVRGEDEL